MLRERLNAVREIEQAFVPAEVAVEDAFCRLAGLLNSMCTVRVDANLPMQTAEAEFDHIAAALRHASEMRQHVLAAHRQFVDTRSAILPNRAFGDNGECPGGTGTTKGEHRLQSVA